MSATGFAITVLLCSTPSECETTAIRAVRFQSVMQCQAALPEALAMAARARPSGAGLTVRCRSLAELCPAPVVNATAAARLLPARVERIGGYSAAIAAVLAVLCAPPPEQGC